MTIDEITSAPPSSRPAISETSVDRLGLNSSSLQQPGCSDTPGHEPRVPGQSASKPKAGHSAMNTTSDRHECRNCNRKISKTLQHSYKHSGSLIELDWGTCKTRMRIVSINESWKKIMDCSVLRGRPSHVVTARGLALLLPKKYAVDADDQPWHCMNHQTPDWGYWFCAHCPSLKSLAPFFLCLAVSNVPDLRYWRSAGMVSTSHGIPSPYTSICHGL